MTIVEIFGVGSRTCGLIARQTDSDAHRNQIKLTFDYFDISPNPVPLLRNNRELFRVLLDEIKCTLSVVKARKPHLTMNFHLYIWTRSDRALHKTTKQDHDNDEVDYLLNCNIQD